MKQDKNTKKNKAIKDIYDLLDIEYSESEIDDNDSHKKKNNDNKEINEIKNIQKNDMKFIVEEAELLNLEKEISLFESEEIQYIIENTDTKDDNNKDLIDRLLNPPLEEENDSLYTKIIINSSEEEVNEEEFEYLDNKNKDNEINKIDNTNLNTNNDNFVDEYGSLNNIKNPFIKAQNESKKQNLNGREVKTEKKFEIGPPKFFNKFNAVELDKNYIEEINLIGNISDNNHWYKNIIYKGKKFNTMSNNKTLSNATKISYFCSLHRTTKGNEKINEKEKIRSSMCNARIVYIKLENKYYMDWEHSEYCQKINARPVDNTENLYDINKEVKNYKSFRKYLNEYLNSNPLVSYKTFQQKADILYYKIKCSFEIKKNTLKNIYNSWKKNSRVFTKFSAIENNMTKDNNFFMRDYSNTLLYNKTGKNQFIHEHMIFISNFFIRKLNSAKHWYVDGTFVYPNDFSQLIVILYKEEKLNRRFPGLFALINNKKYEGYLYMFKRIKSILTIEDTENLGLESYTLDFETALQKTFSEIFPLKRCVGCYYHYCRNLREKAREYNLLNKEHTEESNKMLKELYKAPFIYNDNNQIIQEIKDNYYKKNHNYKDFLDYYEKQWANYFIKGILNYAYLKKNERSNSYIENYNRIIKLKLSKYLYGKNHCRISWPLFLYFIKNEEEEYRKLYTELEKKVIIKKIKLDNEPDNNNLNILKNEEININENEILTQKNIDSEKDKQKIIWFKWHCDSCRYDSFSLLYSYIIYKNLLNIERTPDIDIIDYFQNLTAKALNASEDIYEKGIWDFLQNNIDYNYNLCTKELNYKKMGTIFSILDMLKFQKYFCVKYILHEGCSKCNYSVESENYLNPYFFITEEDINNKLSLEYSMIRLLSNDLTQCSICGFTKDGKVIDKIHPNYYRIISNIEYPIFFFISFDLLSDSDIGTELDLKKCEFRRRLQYNKQIIELIKDFLEINNDKYYLRGMICTPKFNHFTALIINNNDNFNNLVKGENYYYDGDTYFHEVRKVKNIKTVLLTDLPYLVLYSKNIDN